ncbi:MAG: DotH/IcmK family type IV secretion protein [Betaproteobacteria bacterium]|nr:DotH/IcmK family type IV secretion protein [Betaproteobacteria bacterium]
MLQPIKTRLKGVTEWTFAIVIGILIAGAIGVFAQPNMSNPPAALPEQPDNSIQSSEPDPAPAASLLTPPPDEPVDTTPPPPLPTMPPLPLPPPSGLGYAVNDEPPVVVYPAQDDLREGVVSDIEARQFTPEQSARLKQIYLDRQSAKATPYVNLPNPVTRTLAVNLDPGVSPAVLRLARGQLTSVVFSDTTGNPWIIEEVGLNRTLFTDGGSQQREKPTNVLTIEPNTPMAYGNISIILRGLPTPVIFILASGQSDVDMRVDAKVPGRNPDATEKIEITGMPAIDVDLGYFLDGVPPKAAKRLKVSGFPDTEAWLYKGKMYVRTAGDAMYPAYLARARSTSGVSVYRFETKYPSVTVTANGAAHTIFVEG